MASKNKTKKARRKKKQEEMEEIERRDKELLGKENHGHNDKELDLPFD